MRPLTPIGLASLAIAVGVMAGACGAPPDVTSRGNPVPSPNPANSSTPQFPPGYTRQPTASPSRTGSPSPSLSPFSEYTAVPCAGRVTADQVINLVKNQTPIRPNAALTGPLCAGSWQYTVLQVPDRESVQAITVTRDSLKLIVAGTDVCTAEVKLQAPSGIRSAANCA